MVAGMFEGLVAQVVEWLVETTAEMITMVLDWILASPQSVMSADTIRALIGQGVVVGRYLLPLMLLLGVIQAASANQPGLIFRLVFIELPLIGAGMVLIAPAVGVLMSASDAITVWVIDETLLASMNAAFGTLPARLVLGTPPAYLAFALMSVAALVGAMLVWAMMLMRNIGVVMSVVLGPMMLAARIWPAARSWTSRWLGLLVALILVKPVIGFTLSIGWAMLGAGVDPTAGFVDLQGVAMGMMAFFAAALVPSFMMKFVPQVSDAIGGSLSSGLGGAALTTVGFATTATYAARTLLPAARHGGSVSSQGGIPISGSGGV